MSDLALKNTDPIIQALFDALEALTRQETQPWADLFVPEGIMEFPFAPPGYPERLEGRAAIAEFIRAYPAHITLHRVVCDRALRAEDVRVVEFHAEATAVATGRAFTMRYVAILTEKDGRIETYRDYWNPLVGLAALGGWDDLNQLGAPQ